MHFELSRQIIDQVQTGGSSGSELMAASDYIAEMGYDDAIEDA